MRTADSGMPSVWTSANTTCGVCQAVGTWRSTGAWAPQLRAAVSNKDKAYRCSPGQNQTKGTSLSQEHLSSETGQAGSLAEGRAPQRSCAGALLHIFDSERHLQQCTLSGFCQCTQATLCRLAGTVREPKIIQCRAPGCSLATLQACCSPTLSATVRLMPNAHGLCVARIMHAAFDMSARATEASCAGQGKPSPV